jgi:ACR3 family arsenite transporter
VPITLQVYFNAGLAYGLMKWLEVEHSVAAPGALIGASNFFELAVERRLLCLDLNPAPH